MDVYDKVINKNKLSIKEVPSLPGSNESPFISFIISFDNFSKYLNEIERISSTLPIVCTIYDESIISCDNDVILRLNFLESIKNLNFKEINFNLSEATLPLYNTIMQRINWPHESVTLLNLTLDRYPTEIKDLRLEKAKGKILLREEQLLWQSDYVLSKLYGRVDKQVLEDTDKLKYVIRHYVDSLERHYHFDSLTDFDKVVLAFHFIKDRDKLNIAFANTQTIIGLDGLQHLLESESKWESKPYGTYIKRKGVCEGQARLFRCLLNNWDMQVNATTLEGMSPLGPHCWLGVVIDNKLYYCCTTQYKLFDRTNFVPKNDEYYPKLYELSSLSNEDKIKIAMHIRKIRR